MAIGPDGFYYLADQQNNASRRVNPATGFTETIAGDGQPGYVDSGDSTDENFSVPRFNNPLGIAVAGDGAIYVADYGNRVIRRVRISGSGVTALIPTALVRPARRPAAPLAPWRRRYPLQLVRDGGVRSHRGRCRPPHHYSVAL